VIETNMAIEADTEARALIDSAPQQAQSNDYSQIKTAIGTPEASIAA